MGRDLESEGAEFRVVDGGNRSIQARGFQGEPTHRAEVAAASGAHRLFANGRKGTDELFSVTGELGKVWFHKAVTIARVLQPVNKWTSSLGVDGWMSTGGYCSRDLRRDPLNKGQETARTASFNRKVGAFGAGGCLVSKQVIPIDGQNGEGVKGRGFPISILRRKYVE